MPIAEMPPLSDDDQTFLSPYLPRDAEAEAGNGDLPFVTLTYASSLDGMIAAAPGARTALSGAESKSMTHYLRFRHDAILVGAGTAATDDPGLNCRYPHATLDHQPRPIIVDPNRKWRGEGAKAYRLAAEGQGKAPWIVVWASDDASSASSSGDPLLQIGGDYLVAELPRPGPPGARISWTSILRALKRRGISSVMIEGGATVIDALLSSPDLVESVIITIAPTFLGQGGVSVSPAPKTEHGQRVHSAWLHETSWRQFGNDVVLCGKLRR